MGGYATNAAEVINKKNIDITPTDATNIMASIQGNFENMLEPCEIFELLDKLGAHFSPR
jgi:hypothetical protein